MSNPLTSVHDLIDRYVEMMGCRPEVITMHPTSLEGIEEYMRDYMLVLPGNERQARAGGLAVIEGVPVIVRSGWRDDIIALGRLDDLFPEE